MHIPDGYLSPATCATLYTGSAPFWWVSLRRMQRGLNTHMVPLLSVFAAFSFIIMMFNLPLPGGTTGHAVGVGIAAIVLGPWASILAISIALIIQALLFGDGGITAIGANCFNMAILGSLSAYGIYRLLAGRAPIESPRRVMAGAIAGYVAINLSALAAAVELGIQPLLYRDAAGAALYAPYPLQIAIPAMMAGHLTVAGLAEMVVSGGVVAYLQRMEPNLLRATAPGARTNEESRWKATKPLWIALAVLAILTPLGILAAGSAWGEWSVSDFLHPQTRQQIANASAGQAPPSQAPAGLQRLAPLWTAPFSRYAPPFLKSAALGYMLSALIGMVLIIIVGLLAGALLRRRSRSFIEATLASLLRASEYASAAEHSAESGGLLQRVDPRVKVVGLILLVIVVAASRHLVVIGTLFAFALALALCFRHRGRQTRKLGLASSAYLHWSNRTARDSIRSARRAQRGLLAITRGNGSDFIGAAGSHNALALGSEVAASLEVPHRTGGDPGHDLSLRVRNPAHRTRHVRVAQKPHRGFAERGGEPPPGRIRCRSALEQKRPPQQRCAPGHAVARFSGRSPRAARLPRARRRLVLARRIRTSRRSRAVVGALTA